MPLFGCGGGPDWDEDEDDDTLVIGSGGIEWWLLSP